MALEDGTFWVSEEYGPSVIHVDRRGRTLERIGPFEGPRKLEELSAAELREAGIAAVSKRLVVDLLDPALGYRHDKAEALAVLGEGRIAVVNDDDFGFDGDGRGGCVPKTNPATGEVDRNRVYLVRAPGSAGFVTGSVGIRHPVACAHLFSATHALRFAPSRNAIEPAIAIGGHSQHRGWPPHLTPRRHSAILPA